MQASRGAPSVHVHGRDVRPRLAVLAVQTDDTAERAERDLPLAELHGRAAEREPALVEQAVHGERALVALDRELPLLAVHVVRAERAHGARVLAAGLLPCETVLLGVVGHVAEDAEHLGRLLLGEVLADHRLGLGLVAACRDAEHRLLAHVEIGEDGRGHAREAHVGVAESELALEGAERREVDHELAGDTRVRGEDALLDLERLELRAELLELRQGAEEEGVRVGRKVGRVAEHAHDEAQTLGDHELVNRPYRAQGCVGLAPVT